MKDFLVEILRAKDASRARSNQTQVGPSELGGCRRKVWYRLNNQPETNENELKLAAIMGTAIHSAIEQALAHADPSGEKYVVESEVEYAGIKAHVDLWIPETGDVVDWKSVKKQNLSYFPSQQQRWQVQVYGYLIDKSGKGKVRNVNLVAIPRDGDERDIFVYSEPYDPKIAEEALNWLAAIKETTEAPEPEKDVNFCKSYCKYYDETGVMGCVGLKKGNGEENEVIIDSPEADSHAMEYLQLDNQIKELELKKSALRASLEGFTGTTLSGFKIHWSTQQGRKSVDVDALSKVISEIPYKQGQETTRLTVKQTGGK